MSRSQIQRAESPPTYKHIACLLSFSLFYVPDLYYEIPTPYAFLQLSCTFFPRCLCHGFVSFPILLSFFHSYAFSYIIGKSGTLRAIPGLEARRSDSHKHIPQRVFFYPFFFFFSSGWEVLLLSLYTYIPLYPQKHTP